MPSPQGRMTAGMMRKMAMLRKGTPKKSKAMPSVSKGTPKAMPGFSKGTSKAMPGFSKGTSKAMPGFSKGTPKRSAPIPKKKRILKESPYMRGGR